MAKYLVKNKCYGFLGRMWEAGEEVEISDKQTPPEEHFELIGEKKPAAAAKAPSAPSAKAK